MISPSIYILASKPNGTLYIGSTSNLPQRIWQHKHNLIDGFSKTHSVYSLVYFEQHDDMYSVICRERQLKRWNRAWKLELIEKNNPKWDDLYPSIL